MKKPTVSNFLVRAESPEQAQKWREAAQTDGRSLNAWMVRALNSQAAFATRVKKAGK